MEKTMRAMMLTALVLVFLLSGCSFQSDPPAVIDDIQDILTISDTFNFETTRVVELNLAIPSVSTIPVQIYGASGISESSFYTTDSPLLLSDLPLLATVVLDTDGAYDGSITIPSLYRQLVIRPLWPGLPDISIVEIEGDAASLTLSVTRSAPGTRTLSVRDVSPDSDTYYTVGDYTFLAPFSSFGLPDNIKEESLLSDEEKESILAEIAASLPEYRENTDRLSDAEITLTEDARVQVVFMHEGAGYLNSFGLLQYDTDDIPIEAPEPDADLDEDGHADLKIILPNASISSRGLISGDTVDLGTIPAGKTLIWALVANGFNSATQSVTDGLGTYYSKREWNPETDTDPEFNQHMVLLLEEHDEETDHARFVLGFEDLERPRGDDDFNDLVIVVDITPGSAVDGIEESDSFIKTTQSQDRDLDSVPDEVDAYPDNSHLSADIRVSGTAAFEDQWPTKGDYDFNDLVIYYEYILRTDANNDVRSFTYIFDILAAGAGQDNGLAMKLPVDSSDMLGEGTFDALIVSEGDFPDESAATGYESVEDGTVLRFFSHVFDEVFDTDQTIINTDIEGNQQPVPTVSGTMYFADGVLKAEDLGNLPYDLFLIKSDGVREVHYPDLPPSGLQENNPGIGEGDDDSVPALGRYYKTSTNLPWALHVPLRWDYPSERNQIIKGYRYFADWAGSNGADHQDWYVDTSDHINRDFIY